MNILVTRPKHQSERLIQALESQGHTVQLLPLLEIKPLVFSGVQRKLILEKLQTADRIIAVSANAATLALPLLDEIAPLEATKSICSESLFAIGPSTARILEDKGYLVSIPELEYNSENLLALPAFDHIKGKTIALLCGKGGRDYLELGLSDRGAKVERIELYERTPVDHCPVDTQGLVEPEALTAMSGDTVEALESLLADSGLTHWMAIPLMVPGNRVADIASDKGFSNVFIAQKPTTESLLEVLGSIK